ncbi:hypothetical protein Bca4012_089652 [Brassica carinata]
MIGDSDSDSGSKEITKEKGDGGLLEITDLDVSQRKEVGRGGSPVRRSEAVDIGLEKVLIELESLSGRENLSSKAPPVEDVDQLSSEQQVEEIKEKEWALVTLTNGGMASPGKVVKAVEGYTSSNGFQILQDLREESEINEDDVDDEVDDEVEGGVGAVVEAEDDGARGIGDQVAGNTTVTASLTEVVETKDLIIPPKHSSSTRGRDRGSKRPILNLGLQRTRKIFHLPSLGRPISVSNQPPPPSSVVSIRLHRRVHAFTVVLLPPPPLSCSCKPSPPLPSSPCSHKSPLPPQCS